MKKTTITILTIGMLLSMIGLALAETYYAGDNFEIPTDYEIVNCSVIDSTYDLEGLNLNWSGKKIIISTSPYYYPDNLTISCWVIKYGEEVEQHYSSGGYSCSYNPNYDWKCGSWTDCINGIQTRTCNTYNNCGGTYGRPDVTNNCSDKIILDVNDTIIDDPIIVDDDLSWWDKFVNWLKRLFKRD